MDVLQAWLVVGVPGLVVAGSLFAGRSRPRAWIGYGVLAGLTAFFVLVPGDAASAALVGILAAMFVATGRGTHLDDRYFEHHQERRRLTTAREGPEGAASP